MNDILALLLSLAPWVGWTLVLVAVANIAKLGYPDSNRNDLLRRFAINGGIGAALLTLDAVANKKPEGSWGLPLIWFSMPIPGYLAVICLILAGVYAVQGFQAITAEERKNKLINAVGWVAGCGFLIWFVMHNQGTVKVLKGMIPIGFSTFGAIIGGLAAATAAMIVAGRAAKARGFAKTAVSHLMLIAGSIVFALPFAFLVITSFKEDRDMSSPDGIVWVPKVQETVPFLDPKNPLYETEYNGGKVQATILEALDGDRVRMDISKPLSIRGTSFETTRPTLREVPRDVPKVTVKWPSGEAVTGMEVEILEDGRKLVEALEPAALKGKRETFEPSKVEPIRNTGLRWQNYPEAFSFMPPETNNGLVYLKNTMIIVFFSVVGTILSSAIVAYAFSRMQFPGRNLLFGIMLSTMMLPGAVTLLPQFLIFRGLGWIDTLYPLWAPAFFASAFNVFMLRQFFSGIPMELEDAAKIDGCSYLKTFWSVMLPQIKPALAVIAIWTFMGAWNNFMGPLIYVSSPEQMPLSYALQLFQSDRGGEPGLLMAVATLSILPIVLLFFFAQKYFIEGVQLSGLGGR
jgi:multiple sugar transport system permease protein